MIDLVIKLLSNLLEKLLKRQSPIEHRCISCGHVYVCTKERCPLIESLVCATCQDYYIHVRKVRKEALSSECSDRETET